MKRYFLLLAIFTISFSCSKKNNIAIRDQLIGTWELASSQSYVENRLHEPGNGNLKKFRKDGSYERWQANTIVHQGSYLLSIKKDCTAGNSDIILTTSENSNDIYYYITVTDNTLKIYTSNCIADGGSSTYRRIE